MKKITAVFAATLAGLTLFTGCAGSHPMGSESFLFPEEEGVYTVAAEVFGKGIDMWLKSQGSMIKMID